MERNGVSDLDSVFKNLMIDEMYIRKVEIDILSLDLIEGKRILKEIINFTKENNLKYAYAWSIFNIGKLYNQEEAYECADMIFKEAYDVFEENNDINGVLSAIGGFIATKCMMQKYKEAIEWGIKGIDMAEKHKNIERLLAIKGNISKLYMEIEQYDKALEVLIETDEIPLVGNISNRMVLNINRVTCEIEENKLDKALQNLESIKSYVDNIPIFNVKWLIEKSKISARQGKLKEAENEILKAFNISEELNLYEIIDEVKIYLSDIYFYKKEYYKVIDILKSIEKNIERSNILRLRTKLYNDLNISYKEINDYKNAYNYFEKYVSLKDEIKNIQNTTEVSLLDAKKEYMSKKDYKLLYEENKLMLEIGKKIISSITLGDIFKVISREINKVIKHDGIEIVAYDNKSKSYKIELAIEENNVVELKESKILDDTLIKYSIDNKEEIIINDIFKEYYHYIKDIERYNKFVAERYPKWKNESNSNSAMIIPIIIKNNVIGCISVYSYESNAYAMKDLVRFKILSAYIGIALENSKLYKEVEYNANYDALTNIYNRRRSIYKINKIRNNIDKISGKYYLAMIDIDNFKKINDVYGHNAGDKILVEVSNLIKENIDKKDILGRYGGEEFILVFDGKEDYIAILESIRVKIQNLKIKYQDNLISVTVSIGVEELYDSSRTLEENVSIADRKLYKAKNTTKNLVVY